MAVGNKREEEWLEMWALAGSIEKYLQEMERFMFEEVCERDEEELEEMEEKLVRVERMMMRRKSLAKLLRENERTERSEEVEGGIKKSEEVEGEMSCEPTGVVQPTQEGGMCQLYREAEGSDNFERDESKGSLAGHYSDVVPISPQVFLSSTKFSSSYSLEVEEEVRDTWRADLSDCCGCIDGSFGGLSLDFEEILLKEKGPEEKDWYQEANSWSNCWWFNMLEGGIHQMRDKVMLLPWERAVSMK